MASCKARSYVDGGNPYLTRGTGRMLRTDHLSKDYGRFRALDDLSLEVAPGEVFGILGPNGSGKTTALRLVLGFLRPTSGHASVGGHDSWHDSVAARSLVAYLPGELRLYETMTGRQLISFLSALRGRPARGNLDALARRFDIDLSRPLANLSSGMKRKVALLQVLVADVPLLIMDEPTNALDPTMRDELLDQVRQASGRGQTVVFSSHVLAEAEQVCNRVAVLRKGRLVHLQAMSELRQGRRVSARYASGTAPPDVTALPVLPGLQLLERKDGRLTLEHTGSLPDLLGWLASQPLTELHVEPLGLASVYARYHGDAV
jgi:ABC-2 type transport system ATP-binding protein